MSKSTIYKFVGAFLFSVVLIMGFVGLQSLFYSTKMATLSIGDINVEVEVANTKEKMLKGLGGREYLGRDKGMLFVFEKSDYWGFWMEDMILPLDFIWMDENWKIVYILEDISPDSYPKQYNPPVPVKYVLEVNAGFIEKRGIEVGEVVTLDI